MAINSNNIAKGLGLGYLVYNLADHAMKDLLVVEHLRHGTNPINYLSIRFIGGKVTHGGKHCGSTTNYCDDDTRGKFYFFKDYDLGNDPRKYFCPNIHKFLSSENLLPFKTMILGFIALLVTPTLKFAFTSDETNASHFYNDPKYKFSAEDNSFAYYTTKDVSALRIGLFGNLYAGVNSGIFNRIAKHPGLFICGVAEAGLLVGLCVFSADTVIKNQDILISAAAGFILA